MVNWKWIGYNALLYLAAMQSIPRDIYEAAAIDGAGPWKQLWRITVPMIRPVVIFTVVLSTIGGLQLFTEPMLFDQNAQAATGGANGEWQTIAQLIYKVGWKDLNLGYAAAMSWALFLIIVIVAAVNAADHQPSRRGTQMTVATPSRAGDGRRHRRPPARRSAGAGADGPGAAGHPAAAAGRTCSSAWSSCCRRSRSTGCSSSPPAPTRRWPRSRRPWCPATSS